MYADAADVSAVGSVSTDVSDLTTGQRRFGSPASVAGCTVGGRTRVQECAAHRLRAAGGEQEQHGGRSGRRRQCELSVELRGAGGQHGPVGGDGDRGYHGDEPAGLREAGRDVPCVRERERSARGAWHLLGSRRDDARGRRLHREHGPERGRAHALRRLRPGLGVRLPVGTADGRWGARRGEPSCTRSRRPTTWARARAPRARTCRWTTRARRWRR